MPLGENIMQQKTRIVILGAGFGGVYAYKRLHKVFHHDSNIELVLVNRTNYFLFTPLLHEVATGSIAAENIVEPIRKVLGCCLTDMHVGEVEYISFKEKYVEMLHGRIDYDYLVMGLGSTTNFFGVPGAEENCFTLKSIKDALHIKNRCIDVCEEALHIYDEQERKKMLRMVIIGGGATGVELAAEMVELFHHTLEKYFCNKQIRRDAEIVLVHRDAELLPMFSEELRKKSLQVLRKKGIKIMLNTEVVRVDNQGVHLKNGEVIETHTPIWTAGIQPTPVNLDVKIKNKNGSIPVEQTLNMKDYPEVFCLGDMSGYIDEHTGKPLPALAQVAVKEAESVANNIIRSMQGQPLLNFHYKHKGSMVSLGQWMAIGEVAKFSFSGHLAWWMWRTLYLSKLISWQKKLKVAGNWTLNLFSPRDISRF